MGFEKVHEIDKPLVIQEKIEKTQTINISSERGDITTDPMGLQGWERNSVHTPMPPNLIKLIS